MPYRKSAHHLPTMAERHAERRAAALDSLDVVTAITTARDRSVKGEANRRPWALRHPVLACLIFVALLGVIGAVPPNDASARTAPPAVCYEDMPCFVWSKDGNGQRGVILRSAPAHCTWEGRQFGCITVVSVRRYCRLRRAHRIDLTRTAHLKGDGYAKRYGCRTHA